MFRCALRLWQRQQHGAAYGQPHWQTHAHLLAAGEVTRGADQQRLGERRRRAVAAVRDALQANVQASDAIVIVGAPELKMSHDIPYEARQHTELRYFSGCVEPDAILLIELASERATLFLPPRDTAKELWDGARTGAERGVEFFGVDRALPLSDANAVLREHKRLFFSVGPHTRSDSELTRVLRDNAVQSCAPVLQHVRLVKDAAELAVMQETCSAAARAFKQVIRGARVGDREATLSAALLYETRKRGAERLSFPSVVAGGANALTLHYITNNDLLRAGELVLLDGGCELGGYASDITRTFPVDAQFSDAQREVYERVLDVNHRCVKVLREKAGRSISIDYLQQRAKMWLAEHLRELGVQGDVQRYYPHNIGHWLGMDTHDTPAIPNNRLLKAGMCFTIEPGLYLPDTEQVPQKYRNIGIRIEDDIALDEDMQPIVLTKEIGNTIEAMEELRKK